MGISVDLAAAQIEALNALSRRENKRRATLVREAIEQYLANRRPPPLDDAFGLWADRAGDGLAYEREKGSEW